MPVTPSRALLSGALTTGLFATGLSLGVGALTTPAQAFCDDGRVMGGCVTSIDEFPWQVSLFRTGGGTQLGSHFCGGSVVAPRWVLTAAHCIEDFLPTDPSPMAVYFGSTSLEAGGQIVDVQTIYGHPDYRGVGSDDIALLELRNPISVTPVTLSMDVEARDLERVGAEAIVIGWGNTPGQRDLSGTVGMKGGESVVQTVDVFETSPLLLGAEVPVVDNARCDERGDPEAICAGYRSRPVDACAGDSGGPLMVRTRDGYVQVGLVSGGTLCVDEGERFSTYTRVSAYEDWIRATMAGETEVADLRVYPDFSLPATFADSPQRRHHSPQLRQAAHAPDQRVTRHGVARKIVQHRLAVVGAHGDLPVGAAFGLAPLLLGQQRADGGDHVGVAAQMLAFIEAGFEAR
jgi:secreted trypsin-like serine protease